EVSQSLAIHPTEVAIEMRPRQRRAVAAWHQQPARTAHDRFEQIPGRHRRLNLAGALIDGQDQTVAQVSLDLVAYDHAVPAADLHARARSANRFLGAEVFDQRRQLAQITLEALF